MNAGTITALISGLTALVGSISGLIILIVHVIRHQPLPGDNPVNSPVKPGLVNPAIPDPPK